MQLHVRKTCITCSHPFWGSILPSFLTCVCVIVCPIKVRDAASASTGAAETHSEQISSAPHAAHLREPQPASRQDCVYRCFGQLIALCASSVALQLTFVDRHQRSTVRRLSGSLVVA